jgi:hypothetical protein
MEGWRFEVVCFGGGRFRAVSAVRISTWVGAGHGGSGPKGCGKRGLHDSDSDEEEELVAGHGG